MMRFCDSIRRGGFTFIEVLAALLFLAIVIPAIVTGLTVSNRAAVIAERGSTAIQLAENKLSEIMATDDWQSSESSGDFGEDWPGFRWELKHGTWPEDAMTELTISVFFQVQGEERHVDLSTLASETLTQEAI
jgi:type II secretory pathway pseudopilin PulG